MDISEGDIVYVSDYPAPEQAVVLSVENAEALVRVLSTGGEVTFDLFTEKATSGQDLDMRIYDQAAHDELDVRETLNDRLLDKDRLLASRHLQDQCSVEFLTQLADLLDTWYPPYD